MDLRLKGRTALVTGASKGIGRAIARGLAQEGVNLVVLARGKDALDQAAEQIRKEQGVKVLAVQADVRDIGQVKAAANAAKAEFGTVHIVVNNAGSGIRRQDRQITWPDADWVDDLNLKLIGMLRVTQSFMPIMPRDWSGRIINISGVAGTGVLSPALTHGIINSAMNHITKYLAVELAGEQITVNAVVPGIVATEWREVWAENMARQQGKTKAEFLDEYFRKLGVLAGRWASMEEVSDTVVFLASDRARYITGSHVFVDGGFNVNAR